MEYNLELFLIKSEDCIKNAMKMIDVNQSNILFVVDEKLKLLGSLSDGDIRRWILSGGELDANVNDACFKNTFYINENYILDDVRNIVNYKRINCVPILNSVGQIIQLLFREDIFENKPILLKKQLNIPVVIMAGGLGSRLEPFTKVLPKPLIPIGDKTIAEVIIDKFLEYGITDFYFSLFHKSKIIKSYFDELNPSYNISYIHESFPLGTVGSIKLIETKITGDFFITNCDIIIDTDYANVLNFHQKNNYDLTLVGSMMHYKIPYGICEIEQGGQLKELKEKPEYSFLVSTGMYVMKATSISLIPNNELFHITHLIQKIKQNGGKIGVYPISENSWVDTGNWSEYKKTIEKMNL